MQRRDVRRLRDDLLQRVDRAQLLDAPQVRGKRAFALVQRRPGLLGLVECSKRFAAEAIGGKYLGGVVQRDGVFDRRRCIVPQRIDSAERLRDALALDWPVE